VIVTCVSGVMPVFNEMHKPPVQEQIVELTKKIQLYEGDRKAYYESSQWSIKKNRDQIEGLRESNKELHKALAVTLAGDDRVLDKAFEGRHTERIALKNKSSNFAVDVMDTKVSERKKRLNAVRAKTESKQKKVADLQVGLTLLAKDAAKVTSVENGDGEISTELRQLENRLDKQKMKAEEAQHINKVYDKIKAHLQEESKNFPSQLDGVDVEIAKTKTDLVKVESMHVDAQRARDDAKEELVHHEEIIYRERRERETALNRLKAQAEEKKAQAERVERRLQRAQAQEQETLQDTSKPQMTEEEQEKKISSYEEAFLRIKEATGVSGIQEVVARFRSQGDTHKHLDDLKKENTKQIQRLQEEKLKMQQQFEEKKYSGEAKLSSGQRTLEEFQSHLEEQKREQKESSEKLERASQVLVSVKAGVEHLADKLQHLKTTKSHVPTANLSPTSDEYVLNLLSSSEEKLLKLLEELDGAELPSVIQQMEETEFHNTIETKLPSYNTRINMPTTAKIDTFEDDDDSGEDDTAALTRADLKRRAQQLIDAKMKKGRSRPRKKKGGKF